ncbi:MAG: hypothetical protein AB1831_12850 [Pseudomonadota bacterium]
MKSRKLMITALLAALAVPVLAVGFNDNPPGPAGGPGTNWQAPGAATYPRQRLTVEQREQLRQQLANMTPQERRAFMREWRQKYGECWRYRDSFGPGVGPGPGPQGGPGMGPNRAPLN